MDDNVPDESYEPEQESTFLEEFSVGMLVSGMIFAPDPDCEDLELEVEGLPTLKAPGYCVVNLEAIKILEQTKDEDGQELFLVRPIVSSFEQPPEEVIGKCFLVTREQIFPADESVLLACILEGMELLYHHGSTREELLTGIRNLLREAGQDPG
jgi:hypothetical protein